MIVLYLINLKQLTSFVDAYCFLTPIFIEFDFRAVPFRNPELVARKIFFPPTRRPENVKIVVAFRYWTSSKRRLQKNHENRCAPVIEPEDKKLLLNIRILCLQEIPPSSEHSKNSEIAISRLSCAYYFRRKKLFKGGED